MEPDFWHERWERDEIGFHQHDFNRHMQAFISRLGIPRGAHVLVPLCGKSLDMLWLAQAGFRVTGIEISGLAVEGFFSDNGLAFERKVRGNGTVYEAGRIRIYRGDFFSIGTSDLRRIDAVYDRASLVAFPQDMRPRYVRHLDSLLPDSARVLLVALEYPQQEMTGPPFSVSRSEVERLFGPDYRSELVRSEDCLVREPRFREKGLSRLEERVYVLRKS